MNTVTVLEFLDYKMAVKTVAGVREAVEHISTYSSHHSECIITENANTAEYFTKVVDAACVYTNVSPPLPMEHSLTGSRNRHQHAETACLRLMDWQSFVRTNGSSKAEGQTRS